MPLLDAAITLIVQKEIIPQLVITDAFPRIVRNGQYRFKNYVNTIASLDKSFLARPRPRANNLKDISRTNARRVAAVRRGVHRG